MSDAAPDGPEIVTLGCRLNLAESATIAAAARAGGLAGAAIVNTCAVTQAATRDSLRAVRRLARARPGRPILVTGCAATLAPDRFAALPGVARVVANPVKLAPASWTAPGAAPVAVAPNEPTPPGTRGFVEIQQGCDHRCTFCVIPLARGAARSVPLDEIVARVAALAARDVAEVVLTGVDAASWGRDLPGRPTLGAALGRLLAAVPALARLRLSSLDPAALDDDLVAAYAREERLMPHAHLSLQAGDDLVLKRMRRRHSRADALALAALLARARPGIALGADLIAGFPTESEEAAARTRALVDEMRLAFVHVFPFSPREATPAARMPAPAPALVRARAAALRAVAAAARARFLDAQLGRRVAVLVERGGRGGLAESHARVRLARPATPGSIVAASVVGRDGDALLARADA
jgi:threonylcarbamoyladenosine tRNA methylthiotransferase MtaB